MEKRFEEILALAIKRKCTDIHFSINQNDISIQLRGIDGLKPIPCDHNDISLFYYLSYQSKLDVTSTKPQSGSFTTFFQHVYYDFRFAVIMTDKVKSGVLRILNCHQGLTLEQLTFDTIMQKKLGEIMKKRNGLILFTGPTGSGKTTTMYSLLQKIKGKTIYSLEDPIEVVQPNMIQLEINPLTGFGFDEGIRQILRHHPDVVMIGEIRDEVSAKMAVRAALTGALVVSSLHSFSCSSAILRLLDLGCKENDLQDVCQAIFNQRLVKLKGKKGYSCLFDQMDNQAVNDYIEKRIPCDHIQQKIDVAIKNGRIENEEY